jgi:hypothetical protein
MLPPRHDPQKQKTHLPVLLAVGSLNLGLDRSYIMGFQSEHDSAAVTVGRGQQQMLVCWIEIIPLGRVQKGRKSYKSGFLMWPEQNADASGAAAAIF